MYSLEESNINDEFILACISKLNFNDREVTITLEACNATCQQNVDGTVEQNSISSMELCKNDGTCETFIVPTLATTTTTTTTYTTPIVIEPTVTYNAPMVAPINDSSGLNIMASMTLLLILLL